MVKNRVFPVLVPNRLGRGTTERDADNGDALGPKPLDDVNGDIAVIRHARFDFEQPCLGIDDVPDFLFLDQNLPLPSITCYLLQHAILAQAPDAKLRGVSPRAVTVRRIQTSKICVSVTALG